MIRRCKQVQHGVRALKQQEEFVVRPKRPNRGSQVRIDDLTAAVFRDFGIAAGAPTGGGGVGCQLGMSAAVRDSELRGRRGEFTDRRLPSKGRCGGYEHKAPENILEHGNQELHPSLLFIGQRHLAGWLANRATSLAALVSTPGFCRKPRSRNQSMKRYCHVPNGVSLRSVNPPVMWLPSGKASPGWRPLP